jgi:hypothetical protein
MINIGFKASLWQHKVSKEDCIKIIEAAGSHDEELTLRLKRVEDIYKRASNEQIHGFPTLAS